MCTTLGSSKTVLSDYMSCSIGRCDILDLNGVLLAFWKQSRASICLFRLSETFRGPRYVWTSLRGFNSFWKVSRTVYISPDLKTADDPTYAGAVLSKKIRLKMMAWGGDYKVCIPSAHGFWVAPKCLTSSFLCSKQYSATWCVLQSDQKKYEYLSDMLLLARLGDYKALSFEYFTVFITLFKHWKSFKSERIKHNVSSLLCLSKIKSLFRHYDVCTKSSRDWYHVFTE
jgi:hypothetical protein